MSFETTAQVRFAHVDGAGIVFYPRYFEMLNAAVEDWFASALGADFQTMHLRRGIGVPTVDIHAEFLAPCLLGEVLTVSIAPRKVGRSSCAYDAVFTGDGRHRVKARADTGSRRPKRCCTLEYLEDAPDSNEGRVVATLNLQDDVQHL